MGDTTQRDVMPEAESPGSLRDQAKSLSLPVRAETPYLFGDGSSTSASPPNRGSTAPSSETNLPCSPPTLSERLTPLLISAGLVRGTTLTFGRRLLRAGTLVGVSYAPDGKGVDLRKVDCTFWSASSHE